MSYQAKHVDPIYLVRWTGTPTIADLDGILANLQALRNNGATDIRYITVIPPDMPHPDEQTRKYMAESMGKATALCTSLHAVIEGEGIKAGLLRTLLRGIGMLSGHGRAMVIVPSVAAALEEIGAATGKPAAQYAAQLG